MPETSNRDLRLEWDIAFKYYQEQWAHVRHHESLRSTLTFQLLGAAIATAAGYFNVKSADLTVVVTLRIVLATLLVALGLIGWSAVVRIEQAAQIHIKRARAARQGIAFLEPYAAIGNKFPALRPIYLTLNAMIVALGTCLWIAAWFIRTPIGR